MDIAFKDESQKNSHHCVLAVDVGGTKMAGAIVGLDGTLEFEKCAPTHGTHEPLTNLIALLKELQTEAEKLNRTPLGIGLGVPGVTDDQGRSVRLAPGLGWQDMNLGEVLETEFSLPVWVDNDVNVFLRGEVMRGSMQKVKNGIGMTIGTGVGASLLLDGRIYSGSNGAAGEIGYWAFGVPRGQSASKEDFGELESFASGPGIARRAQELLAHEPTAGPILRAMVQDQLEKITASVICAAAQQGDEHCLDILAETGRTLGLVLANLSTVLDVDRIVVGGGVAQAGELLFGPMRETIRLLTPYPPEVVQSALGYRATIVGAAAGFLEKHGFKTP